MGLEEKASSLFQSYAAYCERDQSIYKSASLAVKYAHEGAHDKALEQLKVFATQDNYQYWILVFIDKDPSMKPLKAYPEFDEIMQKIEGRFWESHDRLKKSLVDKRLL